MAFWSSETIRKRGPTATIVTPFKNDRVQNSAYELALGAEAYVTSFENGVVRKLGAGEQLRIPPGQFAMLLTEETVQIPSDALGFISIKARIKFRGLVNVSGFHVDPGYKGKLKFSVYNAGSQPILVANGQPVFLLWLSSLDQETKELYSNRAENDYITTTDVMRLQGEIWSPAEMKTKIEALQHKTDRLIWVGTAVITLLGAAFVRSWGPFDHSPKKATEEPAISSESSSGKPAATGRVVPKREPTTK